MKPENPVLPHNPGAPVFLWEGDGANVLDLPAISVILPDGRHAFVTRWSMTPDEMAHFLETGELYIWAFIDKDKMPPFAPAVERPDITFPEQN